MIPNVTKSKHSFNTNMCKWEIFCQFIYFASYTSKLCINNIWLNWWYIKEKFWAIVQEISCWINCIVLVRWHKKSMLMSWCCQATSHCLSQCWLWSMVSPGHNKLTHWGQVTDICISKLTIIGSDNGLSTGQHQAIIWTNTGTLLTGPLGTNFSEILIKNSNIYIQENASENVWKMAAILSWPRCVKNFVKIRKCGLHLVPS